MYSHTPLEIAGKLYGLLSLIRSYVQRREVLLKGRKWVVPLLELLMNNLRVPFE
jgi:hypothetical protein